MAQTKRKRRTKHRGNAAGAVEVRGRTGRPPTPDERKKQERADRQRARDARLNKPPSWRGAINKALLAATFMFLFLLVTNHFRIIPAVIVALISMALYVPSGFYLDSWLWRRRQRKEGRR